MFVVRNARHLPSYPGASDAGAGPGHVHPVGHRRVTGADHLHEEPGREPAGQEEQEAEGRHLPHQERGRQKPEATRWHQRSLAAFALFAE